MAEIDEGSVIGNYRVIRLLGQGAAVDSASAVFGTGSAGWRKRWRRSAAFGASAGGGRGERGLAQVLAAGETEQRLNCGKRQ